MALYDNTNLYQMPEYWIVPQTAANAEANLTATLTFTTGVVSLKARDQASLARAVEFITSVRRNVVDPVAGKMHFAKDLTSVTFVVGKSETAHQNNPGLLGG